jgi:hypothetical protein
MSSLQLWQFDQKNCRSISAVLLNGRFSKHRLDSHSKNLSLMLARKRLDGGAHKPVRSIISVEHYLSHSNSASMKYHQKAEGKVVVSTTYI